MGDHITVLITRELVEEGDYRKSQTFYYKGWGDNKAPEWTDDKGETVSYDTVGEAHAVIEILKNYSDKISYTSV